MKGLPKLLLLRQKNIRPAIAEIVLCARPLSEVLHLLPQFDGDDLPETYLGSDEDISKIDWRPFHGLRCWIRSEVSDERLMAVLDALMSVGAASVLSDTAADGILIFEAGRLHFPEALCIS